MSTEPDPTPEPSEPEPVTDELFDVEPEDAIDDSDPGSPSADEMS